MLRFFTKTAIGYNHLQHGKPCQDFSASYHDEERTIVTACDGHGSEVHVRSALGSKFAAEAVIKVFKKVTRMLFFRAKAEEANKKLRLEILCEWNALVERHLAEHPLSKAELSTLDEDKVFRLKTDPTVAYGTTLQGAMFFGNKVVCVSLGDGGCFVVKRGMLYPLFEDVEEEENVANVTCSMCQSDAYKHLHVAVFDAKSVQGVMVLTDGLINPYRNLGNFAEKFVAPTVTNLLDGNAGVMNEFITRLGAELGIGDDVSLGIILRDNRTSASRIREKQT